MSIKPRKIVDFISKPGRVWDWTPPTVPDFAGPDDLATVLVSYRNRLRQIEAEGGAHCESPGQVSDTSLSRLLNIAYRASFVENEGKRTRACLFSRRKSLLTPIQSPMRAMDHLVESLVRGSEEFWNSEAHVFRLQKPLPLDDPMLIVRLAPVLQSDDAAIIVADVESNPCVVAVGLLNFEDREHYPYRMPRSGYREEGLSIRIRGPGHLEVSEGEAEYTLRMNGIRIHDAVRSVPSVKEWLYELSKLLLEESARNECWDPSVADIHDQDLMDEYHLPQIDVSYT
jgi:hypothetical protein